VALKPTHLLYKTHTMLPKVVCLHQFVCLCGCRLSYA